MPAVKVALVNVLTCEARVGMALPHAAGAEEGISRPKMPRWSRIPPKVCLLGMMRAGHARPCVLWVWCFSRVGTCPPPLFAAHGFVKAGGIP